MISYSVFFSAGHRVIRYSVYPFSSFHFPFCSYIAQLKQNYTQSNGRRPFGLSCLVGGFDEDGTPHLFQTEPSGIYYEWRANTTGRSSQPVRDYMEKHAEEILASADEPTAIKHIVRTLVGVSSLTASQMDVAVLKFRQPLRMIDRKVLVDLVRTVRSELEAEAEASRLKRVP